MGTMHIKPITWVGTTKEIKDPTILIAISKPIPRYWPNIILRFGKPKEEKNIISTKMSSILVAAKAAIPIATKPTISIND